LATLPHDAARAMIALVLAVSERHTQPISFNAPQSSFDMTIALGSKLHQGINPIVCL
jgi:hypothetical protein